MPARSTSYKDDDIVEFLLVCLTTILADMPYDEWDAHGGFDDTDDENPEYDGSGLGDDDIDGYDDE